MLLDKWVSIVGCILAGSSYCRAIDKLTVELVGMAYKQVEVVAEVVVVEVVAEVVVVVAAAAAVVVVEVVVMLQGKERSHMCSMSGNSRENSIQDRS